MNIWRTFFPSWLRLTSPLPCTLVYLSFYRFFGYPPSTHISSTLHTMEQGTATTAEVDSVRDDCLHLVLTIDWGTKEEVMEEAWDVLDVYNGGVSDEVLAREVSRAVDEAWTTGLQHMNSAGPDVVSIRDLLPETARALTEAHGVRIAASVAEYLSAWELVTSYRECWSLDAAGVLFFSLNDLIDGGATNEEILSNNMTVYVGFITLSDELDVDQMLQEVEALFAEKVSGANVCVKDGCVEVKGVAWISRLGDADGGCSSVCSP